MKITEANNIDVSDMRPILIRHRFSGVWIGFLKGEGSFDHMIEIVGRRVWSWTGGRLECSQLADQGVSEKDRLGEWETVEIAVGRGDGLIELRTISMETALQSREFAADQVGE